MSMNADLHIEPVEMPYLLRKGRHTKDVVLIIKGDVYNGINVFMTKPQAKALANTILQEIDNDV